MYLIFKNPLKNDYQILKNPFCLNLQNFYQGSAATNFKGS